MKKGSIPAARSGSAAREALVNPPLPPPQPVVPTITATMVDSLENDDADGKIDPTNGVPGTTERIKYTVTISNTGTDATGVDFSDTIDSHTTLVANSLNVSPLALDDSYDTIGNTLLEVGPVGSPSAQPKVTVTGNVLANDTEFLADSFTLSKLQAVDFALGTATATSANAGSVTMDSAGKFSYTPVAGFTGDDTFTYTIRDDGTDAVAGNADDLTGTATVTIHVNAQKVWYVQNNAAPGGLGRSTDPFDTLLEAQTASVAGDSIYVFTGNGTTSNQNAGITLKANQRFIGNGVQLDVPVSVNGGPNPTVLRAAGGAPSITNTGGNGVTVTNIAGVSIRGFIIGGNTNAVAATFSAAGGGVTISNNSIAGGTGNAIDVTTSGAAAGGSVTITNNAITGAGAEGIDINANGTGTLIADVNTNTLNATGNAFDLSENAGAVNLNFSTNTGITSADGAGSAVNIVRVTGTLTITGFANNTISGNSAGTGINVLNAIFDGTPGGSFQQVSGGTTIIGAAGNGVGDSGLVLTGISGDLLFTDLDIVNDNGTGLSVAGTAQLNAGAGTGTGISIAAGVGTIASNLGPAVNITTATTDLQFLSLTSTTSPTQGVVLTSVNGTFSGGSGSSITSATGTDFDISGGTANVTYNGTITDDVGRLVSVSGATGGTKSFTGAITDNNDGGGTETGVSLTSNTGATISFRGGLLIRTTTNAAFTATGGGTVEVCDENPCNPAATGALVNTLTTTTGTALNVNATTISGNKLEFRSISANGATNGIVLNATGATGGLTVSGNGGTCSTAVNCTGGAIQNTTNAVLLTTASNVSITRMFIQNSSDSGIKGTSSCANFSFFNGVIDNSGTGLAAQTSNIAFNTDAAGSETNITGTFTVTGSTLTNAFFHGISVKNFGGTLTDINVSSNVITSSTSTATSKGSGIQFNALGGPGGGTTASISKATINLNTITNFPSDAGIMVLGGNATEGGASCTMGSAGNPIAITNNTISGQSAANRIGTQGILFNVNGAGTGNFNVSGNNISNTVGNSISNNVFGDAVVTSVINGNIIVKGDVANTFATSGIVGGTSTTGGFATNTPSLTVTITNNNISQTDGNGILMVARDNATGQLNISIKTNTVAGPLGGVRPGIRVDAGNASGDNDVCLDISGNTSAGTVGMGTQGIGLRKQGTSTTINAFGIEGLPADGSPNIENYVNGLNPAGGGTLLISATSGFTSCGTAPLFLASGGVDSAQDVVSLLTGVESGQVSFPAITTSAFRRSDVPQPAIETSSVATTSLNQEQLDSIVSAAIQRWQSTGLTPNQVATLRGIKFKIAELGGIYLGEASHNRVLIDRKAGGKGWFVDATPMEDSEFGRAASASQRYTVPTEAPAGHIDLLTAIEHEMGHKLGLDDSYVEKDRDSLMYGYLTVGERRLPAPGQAKDARPNALKGSHFLSLGRGEESRDKKTRNVARTSRTAAPMPSGETVNATIGSLPANKTITLTFTVTLNDPPNLSLLNPPRVTTQGTVSGTNFSNVLTDDTAVGGASDSTDTPVDLFDTSTSLVSDLNPSNQGDQVTFTATVSETPAQASANPTGTVDFIDTSNGNAVICNDVALASGQAQCQTSLLTAATHNIRADYSGDGNFDSSQSNLVAQVVNACNNAPVVTKIADTDDGTCDADCSLREAIANACTGSTITFDTAGVFATAQTITLSLGELLVAKNVTIDGPDAAANHVTVSGGGASRVFNINAGKTVTIRDLTVTGGLSGADGGGIFNNQATLTLINMTLSGNNALNGGGISNDGGAGGTATLTITNSTLSGNNATDAGGVGGAVYNNAFSGGTATLTINNSTISGNNAKSGGGGVFSISGGAGSASATTTNVTITNNHADSDNLGGGNGGGANLLAGTYKLRNTIVAGNFTGSGLGTPDDIFGTVDTSDASSNNLIGTGGAGGLTNGTFSNQVGVANPGLGALASNGGPTQTHNLLFGSPAIEAGDNTFSDLVSLTTDQRGAGFIRKADSADADATKTVDIGALEAQATIEDITDKETPEDTPLGVNFNVGDLDQITSVTAISSNAALVTNANLVVTGGPGATRLLTITPEPNVNTPANGTATITVTVTSGSESMQDTFLLTVTAVADLPSVTNTSTNEDTQTTTGLVITKNAADGAEVGFFKITSITSGTLFQNDGSTPIVNGQVITEAEGNAGLKFTPSANSFANGSFQVQGATDGSGNGTGLAATATITVNAVADTPSVSNSTTDEDTQTSTNLVILRNAADGAEVTHFKITGITGGTLFKHDGTTQINNGDFIAVAEAADVGGFGLKFTPAANLFSPTTAFSFTIQASTSNVDGGLGGSTVNATITVNPVADTPTVTNSSTNEDTQTTTGLVISRNAVDNTEVAFFKITSITNGLLFKNDGSTPITNGQFITFAEGNAGLKFTPAANFSGNGTFQVQGSIDGAGTGLSTGFATATITVGSVADVPTVTPATTNEDTQTSAGLVITPNAGDADVTHFKITNITNGLLFQNNGSTPIVNNDVITLAQGGAGLKFTPNANLYSSVSTFSFDVQGATSAGGAGLGNAATASITVNPIADTPSVTNSNTAINTQTTAGLVISRNAADAAEVTHFKITNITNGTLFQNNGTTPINDNDFITFAQGNAGLKFTPGNNLTDPTVFGFDVQASLNNTNGGLGGGTAHATINVNCSSPQVVTSTLDDGSAGTLRYAIINVCPVGTITFNLAAGPQTITLGSQLTINKDVTIIGPANQSVTVSGGGASRVFNITSGNVNISNLTISDGLAGSDGGGLLNTSTGTLTLTGMTFTGSTGDNGGAIATSAGTMNINNCTISGNTATTGDGGGIYHNTAGTVSLLNTTITNNTAGAGQGGGVRATGGTTNVKNTIIAGNAALSNADVGGTIVDQGNNILNGDPKLDVLANNGGPTQTHALLLGSPALDAGDNTAANNAGLSADQRGGLFGRIRDAASDADTTQTVDIGAFEADPSVEDITDKATNEDTALPSFTFRVADSFTAFDSISATSSNTTLVPNANITIGPDTASTRALSISPAANQSGTATITVTVTKTISGTAVSMSDTFLLTVGTVPDTPSVTNTATNEDTQSTTGLVITKNVNDGAEVTHFKITGITNGTLFQNNGTTQITNNSFITEAEGNAGLKFTPAANSITAGSFQVQSSTDAVGTVLSPSSATATIMITPIADTPSVTNATTNEDTQTSSGLVISRNAVDGAEVTHFKITAITGGTLFKNNGTTQITNNSFITFAEGNAGLRFTPTANLFSPGSSFSFTVQAATNGSGAGLSTGSATATITVNSVADTPSVTSATTNEDTQTTSGLVISRNAADGAEVTHFKITNIVGGTLFKNNGTTQITNNSFITFAEGNAGLRFTPTANLYGPSTTFSFNVQGATSAGGAGLGNAATASITVTPIADTPSVTNATTNEDTQTTSGLVISRNAVDGAEVTHFKITGIANGTLFKNNGTTQINNGGFITFAEGNAGLRFTPAVNLFSPSTTFSFNVQAATSSAGAGLSAGSATATITVNSSNDAPSFIQGLDQTVSENAGPQTVNPWATALSTGPVDEAGQTLTFQVTNNTNAGLFSVGPAISSTGTLTYEPAASASGTAAITIVLKDNGGVANGGANTSAPHTFNITVNDGGTLQLSAATFSVLENAGPATITITRTGGSAGTATVQIATSNGTATAGSDYSAVSQTVTFNNGETSKTVDVPITDDLFNEPDQTVNLTLSGVGGSGQLGAPATAVLTILNDDPIGGYLKFSLANYDTTENSRVATITVQRVGTTTQAVSVDYATPDDSSATPTILPCSTPGFVSARCDFTTAIGTLQFAAGETSKTFKVLISQDNYVEGLEPLTLTLSNASSNAVLGSPSTATLTIADDLIETAANPIDDSQNFVRQHYHDFLNREPDAAGLAFWTNEITSCGNNAPCIEVKRINVSAAFFLAIEFQESGYYVYRTYKAGFGDLNPPTVLVPVRYLEFIRDTQEVQRGVIVGQGNWQDLLDANKQAYALAFVKRPEFLVRYPAITSATAFVNSLDANAGNVLTSSERSTLISQLSANPTDPALRADVLMKVAENALLKQQEMNRAFVLMQYFGYLRRNPDAAPESGLNFGGYNFWLNKLNSFNGNFIQAEMVKAFTSSDEYRRRFGP